MGTRSQPGLGSVRAISTGSLRSPAMASKASVLVMGPRTRPSERTRAISCCFGCSRSIRALTGRSAPQLSNLGKGFVVPFQRRQVANDRRHVERPGDGPPIRVEERIPIAGMRPYLLDSLGEGAARGEGHNPRLREHDGLHRTLINVSRPEEGFAASVPQEVAPAEDLPNFTPRWTVSGQRLCLLLVRPRVHRTSPAISETIAPGYVSSVAASSASSASPSDRLGQSSRMQWPYMFREWCLMSNS